MEGLLRLVVLMAGFLALAMSQSTDCSCDIVLILDSSGSIRKKDYPSVISFGQTVVSQLAPKMGKGAKGARVGVVSFSSAVKVVSPISDNAASLTAAIGGMQKTYGTTQTDLAINKATDMLAAAKQPGKCQSIQIMTDGISNYPAMTTRAAAAAKKAGITIVAIGVGPMVNSTELQIMASQPYQTNAIKISEFRGLKQIAHSLWDKCSVPIKNQTSVRNFCECDMMIILDASGSISSQDWQHMKDFARTIIRGYAGRLGLAQVRIGIITFAYRAVLQAPLSYDATALLSVVDSLKKTTGTTNTTDALLRADAELFKHRRAPGACQAIRMVTDGRSNNPKSTAQAAYQVKSKHDINVMAIGVGPLVDKQELGVIASPPLQTNVIKLEKFVSLDQIAHNISDKCIKQPKKEPPLKYNLCHCDLIFIFDASGSITTSNWQEVKNFANIVLTDVKAFLGPTNTRVSIIHFHNKADLVLPLSYNYNEIKGAIDNMKKSDGTTRTWLALDLAHQEFVNYTNGLGKCRYVMVLTDGKSNIPQKTIASAHRLKALDLVWVQGVGIGQQVDKNEVTTITSTTSNLKPEFLTGSDSWAQLSGLAHKWFDKCNVSTPDPVIPTPTPPLVINNCLCDVMLILDASGSIIQGDWVKAKDFARILVTGLAPFMQSNSTRLGIIQYSSRANYVLPLTYDTHLANGIINRLNKTSGTTRTDLALKLAEQQLWGNRQQAVGGCMRVFLITDGQSNNPAATERVAHQLKQVAYVYAYGVGPQANQKELSVVATNGNYTMLQSYSQLSAIAHQIADPCLKKAKEATPTPMIERNDCNCDMMLVFDASGSIWQSHWVNVKKFASTIVSGVSTELASKSMRIGIVIFANSAKLVLPLSSNNVTILNAIAGMQKTSGSTRTWKGIELAQQELMRLNKGLSSCKTIKLITDGNSNIPAKTESAARIAKAKYGITIMAVGVGRLVTNVNELKNIASTPIKKNFYFVDDFTGLEMIAHVISDKCKPKEVFNDCRCDMVMVLDVSGSITLDDLELIKGFALTIVRGMQTKLVSGEVRIGMVTYASKAQMEVNITQSYQTLVTAISNLQKTNGVTRTNLALNLAGKILMANERKPGDCKSIKLVTDGKSTYPNATAAAAQYLKTKLGIQIMAVGVGPRVGMNELQAIASPGAKNLKLMETYGGLNDLAHLIADKCTAYNRKSNCTMKTLMSCLTTGITNTNACAEMDLYKKCAMKAVCPDLSRIWCGMIFNAPSYKNCQQQSFCQMVMTNTSWSKCDLGFYKECYNQMKQTKGLSQCSQLNKYVWCAEAAVCSDLVRYLCVPAKGGKGREQGVTANGCKVTSCGHVVFNGEESDEDELMELATTTQNMHAPEIFKSSSSSWIVVALGCVVAVLAIGLVAVAVQYRKTRAEEDELDEALVEE